MPATSTVATASQPRRPFRVLFGSLRTQLTLALLVPSVIAVFSLAFGSVALAQNAANDRRATSVLGMSNLIRNYLGAVDVEARAAFGLTGMSYDEAAAKTDASLNAIFTEIDTNGADLPAGITRLAATLREDGTAQIDLLRQLVHGNEVPPAGVLGGFANMRSMAILAPRDFATEVSSSKIREQLAALAATLDLDTRLNTEEILLTLWQRQHEPGAQTPMESRVQAADLAGAIRETDIADAGSKQALAKLGSATRTGSFSEDVTGMRQAVGATNGMQLVQGQGAKSDQSNAAALGSYLTQVAKRGVDSTATSVGLVANVKDLSDEHDVDAKIRVVALTVLIVLVVLLAVWMLIFLSRRLINPIVHLVGVTRRRAQDLPRQLATIERGGILAKHEPIAVPKAGPELREFASGLNDLVETAVDLATKETHQRTAVVGMLRTVAHREAALVNRQLELLDTYERHEVDPVFLSRLFNLDHVTTQMRRMCDSLLVLAGASPVRRTTPPLSLVDVVRGASSQIQQYSRVDLDVWYDPRVHGHKVSDLTLLLAELLDNATKYSHPDTRVTVTFTRGTDAALVTIADEGIGLDDAAISTAQGLVDATDPDHFAMFDRLGLQTVARLCQRTGASVSFAGGDEANGTRVAVRIPDVLLADAGAGVSMRLATAQPDETFDDAVNRPASMTLYGQQQ